MSISSGFPALDDSFPKTYTCFIKKFAYYSNKEKEQILKALLERSLSIYTKTFRPESNPGKIGFPNETKVNRFIEHFNLIVPEQLHSKGRIALTFGHSSDRLLIKVLTSAGIIEKSVKDCCNLFPKSHIIEIQICESEVNYIRFRIAASET